jgi:hypothetical protein
VVSQFIPIETSLLGYPTGTCFATYSISDHILTLHSKPPATLSIPPVKSLYSLPCNGLESIVGITPSLSVVHVNVQHSPVPSLTLNSHSSLPLSSPPSMILPVDPMGWSSTHSWMEHDVLLSVSECGELAFWESSSTSEWRCTGNVKTGRSGFRKARCSSAKKSALSAFSVLESFLPSSLWPPLVMQGKDEEELTIWDSKESEFASGLEYCEVYR